MAVDGLTGKGMLIRFLAALVLTYATFNPEGYSFFHWAVEPVVRGQGELARQNLPVKLLAGLLLTAIWAFLIRTTRRSIGLKGVLLMLAILAALVWALIDWHVLSPASTRSIGHLVLIALGLVLGIGLSWSHISRRVSGQVDTDESN
jgi:hypothetical protein